MSLKRDFLRINKEEKVKLFEKTLKNNDINNIKECYISATCYLYMINIECPICMDKKCNYITRCKHTMCYECAKQIKGSCPCCREDNWRRR
jgi:hypothetical protein